MKIEIGSLVKFYTILLLNEGPKHGYTLMKELGIKLGKRISASQVYPFLNLLEKNRLVKAEVIKGRGKKVYRLTKEGKIFVNNFMHKSGTLLVHAIKPSLTVCTHCGCQVYEGGYKETIKGKPILFCCTHCAKSFKKFK